MVSSGRPIVEIMPESIVKESERPYLLESSYGIPEKEENPIKLPLVFDVKEKAKIYTHSWLVPVIYTYEEERGTIALRDMLPASPKATYTLEAVGGERIKKSVRIGIVYVYMRPFIFKLNEECEGLTAEKLKAGIKLSDIEVRVADISSFLLELWNKYGLWDMESLIKDLRRSFRRHIEETLPSTPIEDILTKQTKLREGIRNSLQEFLKSYGITLTDLDIESNVDEKTYNYYFWHLANEVPTDYTFLLSFLGSIPESIQKSVPRAVEIMIAGLLLRSSPSLAEFLKALLEASKEKT